MEGKTQYRVDRVIARKKKICQQRERYLVCGLSTICLLLTVGLAGVFDAVTRRIYFESPTTATFATMLLHEGAGGYVLVGVLAFAAGAILAIIIFGGTKNTKK